MRHLSDQGGAFRLLFVVAAVSALTLAGAGAFLYAERGDGSTGPRCRPAGPTTAPAGRSVGALRTPLYFNGARDGLRYAVGRAEVPTVSGGERTREVLSPRPSGWDSDIVKDPYLIGTKGRQYLFYSGYSDAGSRWGVGLATTTDGRGWRRLRRPVVGPYRIVGDAQPFPVVVPPSGGRGAWTMFFGGSDGIYRTTSPDGITWSARAVVVLRRGEAHQFASGLTPGDIRRTARGWTLLYGVGVRGTWRMGLARSARLDGRFQSVGQVGNRAGRQAATELRTEARRGGKTLRLRQPTRSGPRLVVVSDDAGWQLVHIAHLSRDGTATTRQRLAKNFSEGAAVTPADARSVTPEYLVDSPRGRLLLATAFNLVPGCLLEISILGRVTLEGPRPSVGWDWENSPLVGVGERRSWHSNSAENPVLLRRSAR